MLKSGFEKKNSLKQKGNKKPISTRVNILHLSLGHETEISILKKISRSRLQISEILMNEN